jgi:hypothetical protein
MPPTAPVLACPAAPPPVRLAQQSGAGGSTHSSCGGPRCVTSTSARARDRLSLPFCRRAAVQVRPLQAPHFGWCRCGHCECGVHACTRLDTLVRRCDTFPVMAEPASKPATYDDVLNAPENMSPLVAKLGGLPPPPREGSVGSGRSSLNKLNLNHLPDFGLFPNRLGTAIGPLERRSKPSTPEVAAATFRGEPPLGTDVLRIPLTAFGRAAPRAAGAWRPATPVHARMPTHQA